MYKIDYKAMGLRVKAKRLEMGLTQEKLAELAEISLSHIGEIERGTSICSLAVITNISEILNLNLDNLVKGVDEKNIDKVFSGLLEDLPKGNKELYIKICENIADTLK